MKRVTFSARYQKRFRHPLHQEIITSGPISRAELLMWSPTRDATTLVWCDGEQAATRTAIEAIDSLRDSTYVEDDDGTYAFLRQDAYEFAAPLLDTIAESRVIFLPPVVFLDGGGVEFEAVGESTLLSTFYDDLSDLGDVAIERVHDFERAHTTSSLTDRQAAALEAAVSIGYYDVPRSGSVADVADTLECSTSTAGELIRKAEAAVIRTAIQTR